MTNGFNTYYQRWECPCESLVPPKKLHWGYNKKHKYVKFCSYKCCIEYEKGLREKEKS